MKAESRLEIVERHVAEAEAAIARQQRIIDELEKDGHTTEGSRILLGLLEDHLRSAREALAIMRFRRGGQV